MDLLDITYERLSTTGPEFGDGVSNHGPMAAEALVRLGREDAVEGWVSQYISKLEDAPRGSGRFRDDEWREALGNPRRLGDWDGHFEEELKDAPWRRVLLRWWPRLLPGISAAATHGVIRTGHAVRALSSRESPERVAELGRGLAYWGARYLALPGRPAPSGSLTVDEAIDQIPTLESPPPGPITARMGALGEVRGFDRAINLLAAPSEVPGGLDRLTAAFAGVYLRRGHTNPIPYIHGVTAPAAVRLVLPELPVPLWRPSFNSIWQAVAGLHAAYRAGPQRTAPNGPARSLDSVVDAAIATGDEHAIKFTEACLRQYAVLNDPVFLSAANDAVERLA